jgi:molecular chaperone DnaJ
MAKDYYAILGVGRDATKEDISKAFREKARQYHPDHNPGDPAAVERFKEVSEAFEILNHPDKRSNYDRFGSADEHVARGGTNVHIDPFDMFGDLFKDHFEQHGQHGRRTMKGADSYREVRISLQEAYFGCEKVLDIAPNNPCKKCEGTGAETWDSCSTCNGSGRINTQQGPFTVSITCSRCRGQGRTVQRNCKECNGSGLRPGHRRKQKLDIPAGIEPGINIVIKGEGERIANGVPGDLICQIVIDPHPFYEREGHNLYCVLPLTFAQSVLGHDVELPVFDRVCKIHVPAGTKSGQVLRAKGMGMSVLITSHRQGSTTGDLLIRVQVDPPKNPSAEYLDLVKKLEAMDDKQVYEALDKFKDQVKELYKQQEK